MFHYSNSITNKSGDVLPGYFLQVVDPATGLVVPIYSDKSSTPIITASGVANMAKVDANGIASFYVADGNYNVNIYAQDNTTLKGNYLDVPMVGAVSLTIGTVTMLTAGASPTASIDTSATPAKLNLGLPTTTGPAGPAGTNGTTGTSSGLALLFTGMAGSTIAAGVTTVQTSGYYAAGAGGATYNYNAAVDATFVTANPYISFLSADNRGWLLDTSQGSTAEQWGCQAQWVSDANRGFDNLARLTAAVNYKPNAAVNFAPEVRLGIGNYYISGSLKLLTTVRFIGKDPTRISLASAGNNLTRLVAPTSTTVIKAYASGSNDAMTNTAVDNTRPNSAGLSYIGHMCLMQSTLGAGLTAHAVDATCMLTLENLTYQQIAGNGENIVAYTNAAGRYGNANEWRSTDCVAINVNGNGARYAGSDTNAGRSVGFLTQYPVGLAGIRDDSYYVNLYDGFQSTSCGQTGVYYGGVNWQPIGDSTNVTPGLSTAASHNAWYWNGTAAGPSANYPAWSSATAYTAMGHLIMSNAAVLVGTYMESLGVYGHAPNATVIGPNMGFTTYTSVTSGSSSSGLVSQVGVGMTRNAAGNTSAPMYADCGNTETLDFGTRDFDLGLNTLDDSKRRTLIHYYNDAVAQHFYLRWRDQVSNSITSHDLTWGWVNNGWTMRFTVPGTAAKFGRTTTVPNTVVLGDFAIQHPANGDFTRIIGMGPYVTGQSYAQGEFRFSINPPAGGGTALKVATANGNDASANWRAVASVMGKGTTAQRPTLGVEDQGVPYFDTTLAAAGKPIWWHGTAWVDATGTVV